MNRSDGVEEKDSMVTEGLVEQRERLSYEEALKRYGTGRYQILLLAFFAVGGWGLVISNEGYVWMGGHMAHTCVVPPTMAPYVNVTNSSNISSYQVDADSPGQTLYLASMDQCTYSEVLLSNNGTNITQRSNIPCTEWTYDQSNFISTIMSEWDLNTCNGKWKISLGASLNMLGYLLGCFIFGYLSDRFGRLKIFCMSYATLVVLGIASSYSVNIAMLIVVRFFFGLIAAGTKNTGVVYAAEILAPKWRTLNAPALALGYWFFSVIDTTIASLTREWRTYQLTTACLAAIFIPSYWLLHESPLWLISRGRKEEALKYFHTSGRINREKVPANLDVYYDNKKNDSVKFRYLDFVKTSKIRIITVMLGLLWMLSSTITIGFSYNVGNMTGNVYHNMYIILAGGPIQFFLIPLLHKGRRILFFTAYFSACVVFIVISVMMFYTTLSDAMAIAVPVACGIGRVLIGVSFVGLYTATPELYPTYMRVTALGLCSSFARIGGTIAPYIILLRGQLPSLPYIIFCSLCLVAGSVVFPLPETVGRRLPRSVQELEDDYSIGCSLPCRKRKAVVNIEE